MIKNCLTSTNAGVASSAAYFFYCLAAHAREQNEEDAAVEYLFSVLQIPHKLMYYIQQSAEADSVTHGLIYGIQLLTILIDYPIGKQIFADCNLYFLIESLQSVTSSRVSTFVQEFVRKLGLCGLLPED